MGTPLAVVGLSVVAGVVDALAYFRLGHVFVANMTGNLVLLTIGLADGHGGQAVRSLEALLGFMVGAFIASMVFRIDPQHEKYAVLMMYVEVGILALFASIFFVHGPGPILHPAIAIVVGSFAMGIQSRLARWLNVAGTITTVVTSTLTTLMDDLLHVRRKLRDSEFHVRLLVFFGYGIGALIASLGRYHAALVVIGAACCLVMVIQYLTWRRMRQ